MPGALELAAELAVVVDLAVLDDRRRVPSSFEIGWSPVARSMIESRRAARPTGPSTYAPSESGPRWTSVALIAASRPGSTVPRVDAIPQIPHMRHYSRSRGGQFGAHEELQLLLLLSAALALLLLADPLRIPYPILLVVGGLAARLRAGRADRDPAARRRASSGSCRRSSTRPRSTPACASCGGTCGRSRCSRSGSWRVTMVVGRGRGALRDRPLVGRQLRARRRRLADRSARRDRRSRAGSEFRAARSRSSRARASSTTAPRSSSSSSRSRRSSPARSRSSHATGDFVWTVARRHRGRARDRPRDPLRPLPARQPAARGDDRVPHRLLRVPAGSRARRLRRARRRDGGRLHGLAHAGADDGRDAAPGRRLLGDLQLPPERAPLRARRPAAPADPRPAARPLVGAARRLRRAASGSSSSRRRFVWVFPIAYVPRWLSRSTSRARSDAAVAVHRVRRLGRDARRRHAGRRARDPARRPTPARRSRTAR